MEESKFDVKFLQICSKNGFQWTVIINAMKSFKIFLKLFVFHVEKLVKRKKANNIDIIQKFQVWYTPKISVNPGKFCSQFLLRFSQLELFWNLNFSKAKRWFRTGYVGTGGLARLRRFGPDPKSLTPGRGTGFVIRVGVSHRGQPWPWISWKLQSHFFRNFFYRSKCPQLFLISFPVITKHYKQRSDRLHIFEAVLWPKCSKKKQKVQGRDQLQRLTPTPPAKLHNQFLSLNEYDGCKKKSIQNASAPFHFIAFFECKGRGLPGWEWAKCGSM